MLVNGSHSLAGEPTRSQKRVRSRCPSVIRPQHCSHLGTVCLKGKSNGVRVYALHGLYSGLASARVGRRALHYPWARCSLDVFIV